MTAADSPTLAELLTPRLLQVAELVHKGHSNAIVAELLGLKENTVKVYMGKIFARLRCDSRVTLAIRYEREHHANPK
jgi:DNA-binding NarL/FixJ family response regulator